VGEDARGDALILDEGDEAHGAGTSRAHEHVEAVGALHEGGPLEPSLAGGVVGAGQRGDVVAGEGSRRAAYEAEARAAGVGEAVRFLGYVPDMRSFYDACDVFVLPSRSEGCPNVVLEAMATRCALVVSDAAGTRECLHHGREGMVYPIGDVEAPAAAVTRLVVEPGLREALAARAEERARLEFSADASARRLAALIRRPAVADAASAWRDRAST